MNDRLVRRSGLFLALWFLLTTTNLVFVALDTWAPLHELGGYPCAHHDCGCKTAEQCRTSCCCFPKVPTACSHCAKERPSTRVVATNCNGDRPGHALPPERAEQEKPPVAACPGELTLVLEPVVSPIESPRAAATDPSSRVPI